MTKSNRRAGGRSARHALRAAPLEKDKRPVQPGMKGGFYTPLSQTDIENIHKTALKALELIGIADAPPSGVKIMTQAGGVLGDDGRLRFSPMLVEDMLAKAARGITIYGRDPAYDLILQDKKVHFGTAGAAVHMVDVEGNSYRDSTVQDLHDAAKICEKLDNIHFFQRPMVCRDIADNFELDINTIYASASGTKKHIGTSFVQPSHIEGIFDLLHLIAGGQSAWEARPFVSNSNCFVVPPMKFATESCEVMEACIRKGMPILLLSAGQAGATAPAPIAGAVMQAVAECLAGVVYVNAIRPNHPAIFGTWPFVSDLRTGAMSGGSGEQALLTAACAQMHNFYGLPGGAAAGIADAKMPDMQAGWEQMCSNIMAGLAGLNMVYEAAGMHASLLGFCHESLILGDDMLGQALRCVRGIDVNEDTLSLDVMRNVCLGGSGHYLGQDQTLSLMQSEYIYPSLADRNSPKEWVERGKPELIAQAIKRKKQLLQTSSEALFDVETDSAIREKFKIHLNPF